MRRKTIFIFGSIVLGLALVLLALMLARPSRMTPAKVSPGLIADIPIGEAVSVVAQVVELNGNALKLEILEGNGYDVFDTRTGFFLQAEQPPEVEFVMGEPADVYVGAIAQFEGTKVAADRIRLARIVILTGYVQGPE